jgi:hypothetical protein
LNVLSSRIPDHLTQPIHSKDSTNSFSSASSISSFSISQASTSTSFDSLSIPSSPLSGDLRAILEHPLPNATVGGGGTTTTTTGTLMNGKSGAKHSEFGWCNNANWRWTSQVRIGLLLFFFWPEITVWQRGMV